MKLNRINRLSYIYLLLMLWFVFPVLTNSVLSLFGLGTATVQPSSFPLESGSRTSVRTTIDISYLLLAIIPIHFFLTARRVVDIGWNPILSIFLGLPLINFLLWFWPGDESENEFGEVPEVSRKGVKVFVLGFPFWAIIIAMLASKFSIVGANL